MSAVLPLIRGTHEGADCANCPFAKDGAPHNPVYGEGPEAPAWIIIGEGPGHNEVRHRRPFVGQTGEVVDKILARVGRRRSFAEPSREIWLSNATLCMPFQGADEQARDRAAQACSGRLRAELARFPGRPILTLGAVAARAVIPKETLDAIDPPETGKALRKAQKLKSQPSLKAAITRRKGIDKGTEKLLTKMVAHRRKALIADAIKRYRRRPDETYLAREINRDLAKLRLKAREDAIKAYDLKVKERALKKLAQQDRPKPKKAKPKKVRITDICGSLFDVDVDGSGVRPVIPAIHPAALLRGGGASIAGSHTPDMAFVNLIFDAGKVNALAAGRDIRLHLNVQYELRDADRAVDLFLAVFREALDEGACSLDLETYVDDDQRHHALMAYVAKIRVIGLGTKQRAVSLAWDLLPAWIRLLLQQLLVSVAMTFHNGLYDRTVLQNQHYRFELADAYDCTLLAHHAAFPGNTHRLQAVVAQFCGVGPWKAEFRNADDESLEALAQYNAKDTGGTHALREHLFFYINRNRVKPVYELDKKMAVMASRMHLAGMPVDREINRELINTFTKSLREARESVESIARDPKNRAQIWHYLALGQAEKQRKTDPADFEERYRIRLAAMQLDPDWKWKIGAGKHIAALLQTLGVELYQRTRDGKGELSTKKDILESLTDVPVVREILSFREADKLNSTFLLPIFDRHDAQGNILQYGFADQHSRIHPIWKVHLISGRWASVWPVVSNVPKDKWKKLLGDALLMLLGVELPGVGGKMQLPDGTWIRVNKDKTVSKLVRPNLRRQIRCRPGRVIVGFDYEQIEARVIALISGDPFLMAVFADPSRDIHSEVAAEVFDGFAKLDEDSRLQIREQTKPIEYGWMYLAQAETLHKQLLKEGYQIKFADLLKAYKRLETLMPGVRRWQQQSVYLASQPPYEIRDHVLGRFRTWPMGQVEATEACNAGVQPTASAIMNLGMARFMENSMDSFRELDPLAQVHDAAYFECWEDDVERLKAAIAADFSYRVTRDGRTIEFPAKVKAGVSWDQV